METELTVQTNGKVSIEWGEQKLEIRTGNEFARGVEKWLLEMALKHANGNQTLAAELLGLSRDQVRYRMSKYKIPSAAGRLLTYAAGSSPDPATVLELVAMAKERG